MEREKTDKYEKLENTVLDDRYVIEKLIGIGGMAVVYRARDLYVNENTVALKILKEEAANDETVVKRFKNESRAESLLKHANIVSVYDVSVKGEIKYMVMEYVNGITLKNYLNGKQGPLSFDEIMSYTIQILKALSVAHENEIIHRDIKPQNVMVLKNGQIKVMDFGIAKIANAETVTVTDKAIGTVYYMSPEQARGNTIDRRSDIYSLGAMMYELATGKLPFNGDTPVNVVLKQIKEKPVPPRQINSEIPLGLEQIILCAMSKKPQERFQSADIMLKYLKELQKDKKKKFEQLPSQSFFMNTMASIKGFFKTGKKHG